MTKLVIVQETDPMTFQKAFNSKMEELRECSPSFEFVHSLGHCAYITYEESKTIPIKQSNQCVCGNCSHGKSPSDRVKWVKCPYFGAVNQNRTACENYISEVPYGN